MLEVSGITAAGERDIRDLNISQLQSGHGWSGDMK